MGDIVPFVMVVLAIIGIVVAAEIGTLALLSVTGIAIVTLLVLLAPSFGAERPDIALFLIVPTMISASQNVYLSFVAEHIEGAELQLVVIVNFIYSAALYLVLLLRDDPKMDPARTQLYRKVTVYLAVLISYGLVTVVLFRTEPIAALASARNIAAPLLFFLVGIHASRIVCLKNYLRYLVWLGILAISFGFLESNTPDFWQTIGLQTLWENKGIPISPGTGLPGNFYASEQIDGQFIRRMVGPFADPVNFGTFLFSVFMAAWFLKKRAAVLVVIVASVLTVSKGAFLGMLVLAAFWTRYFASRTVHVLAIMSVAVTGMLFYGFTLTSSTGSTTAHINGFFAAFIELPAHPLGRGMGGTGVLAGLFSEGSESTSAITESGIGMILGQLGVIGFAVYVAFFVVLSKYAHRIQDTRQKLLACGLLYGFILNAAFNEVALSPNSSATYFIILGLVIGADLVGREAVITKTGGTVSPTNPWMSGRAARSPAFRATRQNRVLEETRSRATGPSEDADFPPKDL
ncbi:hypothetical protein FBY31_1796 [Arthrobacter sp. SLBN-100]|uniref:O-antigen ligase family protein n=1 Tax=Arthrobacter sp. SLBN-100 TaxID=2768450 RepID=UPI00114E809D|nr:hypothetical protein [Arthrobacter sp. SLBN-100]TQJ67720.1 hypothetical protein FBY31_1796 [Arthrobacter sp. SLBN-100]